MTEKEFKKGDAKAKSVNLAMRDFHLFMPPEYDIQF